MVHGALVLGLKNKDPAATYRTLREDDPFYQGDG